MFSNYTKIIEFLKEEIRKHKEDWDPSNPRDYIDSFLREMEKVCLRSFSGTFCGSELQKKKKVKDPVMNKKVLCLKFRERVIHKLDLTSKH